jgi:hypothetical protein
MKLYKQKLGEYHFDLSKYGFTKKQMFLLSALDLAPLNKQIFIPCSIKELKESTLNPQKT